MNRLLCRNFHCGQMQWRKGNPGRNGMPEHSIFPWCLMRTETICTGLQENTFVQCLQEIIGG
jgi:hypothetical protein